MKKILKLLTTISLSFALLISSNLTFAYEGDVFDEDKVETWTQWGYPELSQQLIRPGGNTVSSSACGYFALTSAILKEGTYDKDFNPEKMIDLAKEYKMWNNSWGHFNFQRIEELGVGLKLPKIHEFKNAKRHGDEYYWSIDGNWESKQDTIRKLWNEGYYILLCLRNERTNGHYVFVDYVDENGRIRITDSAYKGTWIDEAYFGEFNYMIVLESTNGVKSNKQESVYKDFDKESKEFNQLIRDERFLDEINTFKIIDYPTEF